MEGKDNGLGKQEEREHGVGVVDESWKGAVKSWAPTVAGKQKKHSDRRSC